MNSLDIDIADLSVFLGIPTTRPIEPEITMSLYRTGVHCAGRLRIEPRFIKNCAIITKARDNVIDDFLASDFNRLLWIDSDIEWTVEQFLRMVAWSKLYDVVVAPYPAKMEPCTYFIKTVEPIALNVHGLVDIEGFGLGFAIMSREVVQRIAETKPIALDQMTGKHYRQVFRTDIHEGKFRGEDMAFFADVMELGYKVWLDPMCNVLHHGNKKYDGDFLKAVSAATSAKVA